MSPKSGNTTRFSESAGEKRTFAYLFEIANLNLRLAEEESQKGDESKYEMQHCVTAIVFSAFTFEALINHIGSMYMEDDWDHFERLKTVEKLDLIEHRFSFKVDKGAQTYQLYDKAKVLRDSFAHGKTEYHSMNNCGPLCGSIDKVNLATAVECVRSVRDLCTQVWKQSGEGEDPFVVLSYNGTSGESRDS